MRGVEPIRRALLERARSLAVRGLRWDNFDAFVPSEPDRGFHLDVHINAPNKAAAALIANRLVDLYGMKIKKRHANGTHLLVMPHLVAVTVRAR